MSRLADLRSANEQIEVQVREWKRQRRGTGQDPDDWAAFREHVQAIGAPDPGETPPEDFRRAADEAHRWPAPQGMPGANAPTASSAEGPEATGGKVISEVNSLHPSPSVVGDTGTWPPSAGSGSRTSVWPPREAVDDTKRHENPGQ